MAKKQKFKDAEKEVYEFIARQQKLCQQIRERMANGNGHLNGHNLHDQQDSKPNKKATKT